jgi:PIN domain nuclease of toxin-antitoxin system
MIRLDTHIVVWLYTGDLDKLSRPARALIEAEQLVISPIVQLELTYLHEVGRLMLGGADIVADLRERIGLRLSDLPLTSIVPAAAALNWTRDPFDRLIVADALAANEQLLTKDETIRRNCTLAVWDPARAGRRR